MVRQASETEAKAWAALPSSSEMALRRVTSVALMAGLLTIVTPWSPFSWIFTSSGPEILDNFLAPPVLLGAIFFQWSISGVIAPLSIDILDNQYVYQQWMYWRFAGLQALVYVAVNYGEHEIWRRFAVSAIIGVLWTIGWAATPRRYKLEAWEHLKWIWTVMAFSEATRATRGGRRRW